MSISNCPVCGETHNTDSICIWDNLRYDGVPNADEYFSERKKRYQTLLDNISGVKKLRSKIETKRSDNEYLSLELDRLNVEIADVEGQINSNSRKKLNQQEKELEGLRNQLDGLNQELAQLKENLRDVSDYDDLNSYLRLCRILISINNHKS